MTEEKQELKQLKEWEPVKLDPVKINLGWRGYIPGYKNRTVRKINNQIREKFGDPSQQNSEIEYANQLALEREQEVQTANTIQEEGRSFGRPSLIKYFLLFFVLAVPNDAIDAIELTGFLVIVAWFVSAFLSITSILVMWFTDQEQKRAQGFMKKIEEYQKTGYRVARTGLMISKIFRNTRLAGRVTKNPMFKVVAGAVAEMVPFLSIFPWSSISVLLAYLDERKTYKEAVKTGEEVSGEVYNSPEPVLASNYSNDQEV